MGLQQDDVTEITSYLGSLGGFLESYNCQPEGQVEQDVRKSCGVDVPLMFILVTPVDGKVGGVIRAGAG